MGMHPALPCFAVICSCWWQWKVQRKKKLILLDQTWSKNISKSLEKRLWQQNVRRQAMGAGLGCLGSPEASAGHAEHRHIEEGQNLP